MNARSKVLTVALLFLGSLTFARAQEQAMRMLLAISPCRRQCSSRCKHNHVVRIAEFRWRKAIREGCSQERILSHDKEREPFFTLTDTQFIQIGAGSLGTVAGTPFPTSSVILNQGGLTVVTSGTGLVQPLTQLYTRVKPDERRRERGIGRHASKHQANGKRSRAESSSALLPRADHCNCTIVPPRPASKPRKTCRASAPSK